MVILFDLNGAVIEQVQVGHEIILDFTDNPSTCHIPLSKVAVASQNVGMYTSIADTGTFDFSTNSSSQ